MKMITGFLAPDSGTALIDGKDIREDAVTAKRSFGYLPEGAPLYGDMTPEGFLDFVGRTRGMRRGARSAAVADLVARMELDDVLHRKVETLSKGFRRRVGLAQAILHDPDVLILDEPTDGLDPNQKHQVRELIRSMGHSKAIIISTHILEEVDAICDRTIIIDHGRIVSDGTPAQLHARAPDHNAVSFVVAANDVARLGGLRTIPEVAGIEEKPRPDGSVAIVVLPKRGQFIAELVGRFLREKAIMATDVQTVVGKLDDVFRSVTTRNEG